MGFDVEACDESDYALDAAKRALDEANLAVPLFRARWQDLGQRDARYDVVFNDALHWVYERDELRDVLAGLRDALAPRGALVFFFADGREPEPGAGLKTPRVGLGAVGARPSRGSTPPRARRRR